MNGSNRQELSRFLWGLLVAWFLVVFAAGSIGIFDAGTRYSTRLPISLGLAAMMPVLVFGLWFLASASFREHLMSLNPVVLTAVQTWRVGGVVFLILMANGILPPFFALPAGLGDMFVGITAPFVALALVRNKLSAGRLILWQALGIVDLVVAVTMGVLCSPSPIGILAHGITTRAMGQLPMSLIPTFAVPLLVILEIICIAQVRESGRTSAALHPAPVNA
jgi:hypothetical protein